MSKKKKKLGFLPKDDMVSRDRARFQAELNKTTDPKRKEVLEAIIRVLREDKSNGKEEKRRY